MDSFEELRRALTGNRLRTTGDTEIMCASFKRYLFSESPVLSWMRVSTCMGMPVGVLDKYENIFSYGFISPESNNRISARSIVGNEKEGYTTRAMDFIDMWNIQPLKDEELAKSVVISLRKNLNRVITIHEIFQNEEGLFLIEAYPSIKVECYTEFLKRVTKNVREFNKEFFKIVPLHTDEQFKEFEKLGLKTSYIFNFDRDDLNESSSIKTINEMYKTAYFGLYKQLAPTIEKSSFMKNTELKFIDLYGNVNKQFHIERSNFRND